MEPGAAVWPGTAAVSALQGDHHRMASALRRNSMSKLAIGLILGLKSSSSIAEILQ